METKTYITLSEAAQIAKVNTSSIHYYLWTYGSDSNHLEGYKDDKGRWWITLESLEKKYPGVDSGVKQQIFKNRKTNDTQNAIVLLNSDPNVMVNKKEMFTQLYNEFGKYDWINASVEKIREFFLTQIQHS